MLFPFHATYFEGTEVRSSSGLQRSRPQETGQISRIFGFDAVERLDEAWMEIDAQLPGLDHPWHEKTLRLKQYFIETWMENDEEFPKIWGTIMAIFPPERRITWRGGTAC